MPVYRIENRNLLFVHIPKAGGTSIESWLSQHSNESFRLHRNNRYFPCVPQHFHREIIEMLFSPDFFSYSFCITRNPYTRLLSEYNYRMSHRGRLARLRAKPSFHRWTQHTLRRYRRDPFVYSNHIRPQSEFPLESTEVFRLETDLPELQRRLAEVTGIEFADEIPTANRSRLSETRIDPASVDRIFDFYRADFERFGYDRESYLGS